ncbi:patched domain-containing protein 3-like [Centruroides vittatus]|uniref:patched domain-containing protein 3-like n=1 Tax=Centruroides vittatus TaxID=120091 RepID=UPI00350EE79A
MNTSEFIYIPRVASTKNECIIILYTKEDRNIFENDIIHEVVYFDNVIKNISVQRNGKIANYSTLCGKQRGKCFQNEIIELIPHARDIISGKYKIKYPFDIDKVTFFYKPHAMSIGGVTVDSKGYLQKAQAFTFFYTFDTSDSSKLKDISEWRKTLNKILRQLEFRHLNLAFINFESLEDEIKEYSSVLRPLSPIVFMIVATFSFIICMTNDWITSKPWLGLSACISALLAILSGFGLILFCGINSLDVNFAIMFAILAMEIDDAFVFIAAWRKTNPEDSVEERIQKTYSEAAISVTVTSITNLFAFVIGMTSPFPGISLFNLFAGVCICFTYIYLMTFFGSCMVLSGFREQKRLHCFTFRHIEDSRTEDSRNDHKKENFIMAKFRDYISNMLEKKYIKFILFCIFFCNFALSIWGLDYIQEGNDYKEAFKDNSEFSTFWNANFKYFSRYNFPIHLIFDEPLNYADPKIQKSIDELCKKFENHPHIADISIRVSWLKYYEEFQSSLVGKILLSPYNLSKEQDFTNGLRNVFLKLKPAKEFTLDIAFDKNFTKIIASRILLLTKDVTDDNIIINIMKDSYAIASKSPIPVKVHNTQFYLMEQRLLIKYATFQTAIVASALICIIFFLFIPDVKSVICVAVIVFCIIFETLGYMCLWNAKLDIPALCTFILCIGFSINYPIHISFSFISAKNKDSHERIRKCIYDVGFPIIQGSMSTILGILILAFQPFYSIVLFFKIIFLIALLTTFHAMFIIPITLSIIQNLNCTSAFKKRRINN